MDVLFSKIMGNTFSLNDFDDGSSSAANIRSVQKSVGQVSHVLSLAVQEGTTRLDDIRSELIQTRSDMVLMEGQMTKLNKRAESRAIDSATATRFDAIDQNLSKLDEKISKMDVKLSDLHVMLNRLSKRDQIMRDALLYVDDEASENGLTKVPIRRPRNVPSTRQNA